MSLNIRRTSLIRRRYQTKVQNCWFLPRSIARDCGGLLQENHQMLAWFVPPAVIPALALLAAALLR
jgi:hypothetical protein